MGRIRNFILQKIKGGLRSTNLIRLKGNGSIDPKAKVKDAVLVGRVVLHEQCKIIDGVTITAESPVEVGCYTTINGPGTDIYARVNPVTIGKFCSIARQVSMQEYNHRLDRLSSYFMGQNVFRDGTEGDIYSKGPITVGNDVWIGAQCVILSGVNIGDGAVVGANAVVTSDVPAYAIVSGSPAKIVRYRFSQDIIDALLVLRWWDWPMEKILRNKDLFRDELTIDKLKAIK
ncbi:MAG TPA: CatB-related O-acetyltransferase [Chryseolinea sp.]